MIDLVVYVVPILVVLYTLYNFIDSYHYKKYQQLIPLSGYRVIKDFPTIQNLHEKNEHLFCFKKNDVIFVVKRLKKDIITYKILFNDQLLEINQFEYMRHELVEKGFKSVLFYGIKCELLLERIDKK